MLIKEGEFPEPTAAIIDISRRYLLVLRIFRYANFSRECVRKRESERMREERSFARAFCVRANEEPRETLDARLLVLHILHNALRVIFDFTPLNNERVQKTSSKFSRISCDLFF